MIDDDVEFGDNVKIFDRGLVNIFGCKIGDNTFIGPFVEITRGVVIGKNCKIESHSFICDSVHIENNVFIGHGVMFTNNLYPQVGHHEAYKTIAVGEGASIGSNATIIAGVTIGKYAVIGAGAVVTKDVSSFSIAAGNPAKVIKQFHNLEQLNEHMKKKQPQRSEKQK